MGSLSSKAGLNERYSSRSKVRAPSCFDLGKWEKVVLVFDAKQKDGAQKCFMFLYLTAFQLTKDSLFAAVKLLMSSWSLFTTRAH